MLDVLVLVDRNVKLLQIGREASRRSIEALHGISVGRVLVPVDDGRHVGGSSSEFGFNVHGLLYSPCASAKTAVRMDDFRTVKAHGEGKFKFAHSRTKLECEHSEGNPKPQCKQYEGRVTADS